MVGPPRVPGRLDPGRVDTATREVGREHQKSVGRDDLALGVAQRGARERGAVVVVGLEAMRRRGFDRAGQLGDGLPAFGIVAAVMGVVKTMGSVHLPPAELGVLIGAALTGTFLGILLAYGFVSPLANLLEQKLNESTKIYQTVKVTLLASINGYAPAIAVEFGRKVLYSTERPSFSQLEEHVKGAKSR